MWHVVWYAVWHVAIYTQRAWNIVINVIEFKGMSAYSVLNQNVLGTKQEY